MTTAATRTTIRLTAPGYVEMAYTDELGERVERTFTARLDGERGYVHEEMAGGDRRQVCERLHSQGPTLTASADTLLSVIRREYRAQRAADKRRAARDGY